MANDYGKSHSLVMKNEQPIDLVQDVTTDCSVVASLCAIISQVQRGYSKA